MIDCILENGKKVFWRHIAVDALIVKNKQILLEKRSQPKGKIIFEAGKWAMPGGYVDRNETLTQAVIRETMEETGWEIKVEKLLFIKDKPDRCKDDRQTIAIIFLCTPVKQKTNKTEETSNLKLFTLTTLPDKEKVAFDHYESIELYKKLVNKPNSFPVII